MYTIAPCPQECCVIHAYYEHALCLRFRGWGSVVNESANPFRVDEGEVKHQFTDKLIVFTQH